MSFTFRICWGYDVRYRRLFLLVEGDDDERFFADIIRPLLEPHYDHAQMWKYSQKKQNQVERFLRSIRRMSADYLYVADLDDAPCITARKDELQQSVSGLDKTKVCIVVAEIESWYYAGIDGTAAGTLGVDPVGRTDNMTKEDFETLIPESFESRIDFRNEVLQRFSPTEARRKNASFAYLLRRLSTTL